MGDQNQRLEKALFDVSRGMPLKRAAITHSIPRTTLRDKYHGRYKKNVKGPDTNLPESYEKSICTWIQTCNRAGFPVSKVQLINTVHELVVKNNIETKFKDNKPGYKWVSLFLARYPILSVRTSQTLVRARAEVTVENLESWFRDVKNYIETEELQEALDDSRRVFNCDETAFFLAPNVGKVLAERGDKTVYSVSGNSDRENITVLLGGNANNELMPPMIVFKGIRMPKKKITDSIPSEWVIGKSESGWMTSSTFYEFMANAFNPWLEEKKIPKPVILFLDGHVSHMSLHVSEFCAKNQIHLLALYPHATHLLQPMDKAVFKPLKTNWKTAVQEWRHKNGIETLKRHQFCPLLKTVLDNMSPEILSSGFKACGLYPFSKEAVLEQLTAENPQIPPKEQSYSQSYFSHLQLLEREIGPEKLAEFKSGKYNTNDESLFVIWKKWSQKSLNSSINLSASSTSVNFTHTANEALLSSPVIHHSTPLREVNVPHESPTVNLQGPSTSTTNITQQDTTTVVSNESPIPGPSTSTANIIQQNISTVDLVPTPIKRALPISNIPTPIKQHLKWPGKIKNTKVGEKGASKMLFAITSRSWREREEERENRKQKADEEKEERKKIRFQKQNLKKTKELVKQKKKKVVSKKGKNKKGAPNESFSSESEGSEIDLPHSNGSSGNEEDAECLYCTGGLKYYFI